MAIDRVDLRRHALLELNILNATDAIGQELEGLSLGRGTPIHDLNGTVLYERLPFAGTRRGEGFVDVATNPAMGGVIIAVSHGIEWNEEAILAQARDAAGRQLADREADSIRFVAYSFPKIAVQFLAEGKELAMLELWTWQPVSRRRKRRDEGLPSNFERWSFLDEQPAAELAKRRARLRSRVRRIDSVLTAERALDRVSRDRLVDMVRFDITDILFDRRELHFTTRNADHNP